MPITSLLQSWIPLTVIQGFGAIVVLLLLLFVVGAIIYAIAVKITKKPPASVNFSQMPLLRPVPIPTKNRSFFMRILVWIYDVRKWELAANWEYQLNPGERIILPEGFQFDGASIPRGSTLPASRKTGQNYKPCMDFEWDDTIRIAVK